MEYTIRFLNGARTDLLGTATGEEGFNALLQAPIPETMEGKEFKYWADFGGTDLTESLTAVTEDMTVVPYYEDIGQVYFTVRFLNYDRTDLLGTASVREGDSALGLAPEPEDLSSQNLYFRYWADFGGTDLTESLAAVSGDMTVVPYYVAIPKWTVEFMDCSGTKALSTQTVLDGEDADPPAPEKAVNMMFLGWDTPYKEVHSDLTIHPMYSIVPEHTVMNVYDKEENGETGKKVATFRTVVSCTVSEKLSGECTISAKLLSRMAAGVITMERRVEVRGLLFDITGVRKVISSGMVYTEFSGEHISYLLNDERYRVESLILSGTPKSVLMSLLADTPFTVGKVEPANAITLRVNKDATRRACLMQVIALAGCEIDYYGLSIGCVKHRGSETPVNLMKECSVRDISLTQDRTDGTNNYSVSLFKTDGLELGDELDLSFYPMEITDRQRIVGIDRNPFNPRECNIEIGTYLPTISDTLCEVVSKTQTLSDPNAKYTIEFGEIIGNGTFYFTRAYRDEPYWMTKVSDDSNITVTLIRRDGSAFGAYVGASITGAANTTETLVVFYLGIPDYSRE